MPNAYLIDMDGVLIKGRHSISGAAPFLDRLQTSGTPFLVLINNSLFTPRDHYARLQAMGLDIPALSIFTSALATARFLQQQLNSIVRRSHPYQPAWCKTISDRASTRTG